MRPVAVGDVIRVSAHSVLLAAIVSWGANVDAPPSVSADAVERTAGDSVVYLPYVGNRAETRPAARSAALGGRTRAVDVADGLLYVGVGRGIEVLDLQEPGEPNLLGRSDPLPFEVRALLVEGDRAYVLSISDYVGDAALSILSLANRVHPTSIVELVLTEGLGTDRFYKGELALKGSSLFAGNYAGTMVFDIADERAPRVVADLDYDGQSNVSGLALDGRYLYLAERDGVRVVDISNPALPWQLGFHEFPSATDIVVQGNLAFVTHARLLTPRGYPTPEVDTGLTILDISDPTAPAELAFVSTAGDACTVAIQGGYAFVGVELPARQGRDDTSALEVVDVANPTNPRSLGTTIPEESAVRHYADTQQMVTYADHVYVTNEWSGLRVYDVGEPAAARFASERGTYNVRGLCGVEDGYAYVCTLGGLKVLDISNPLLAEVVAQVPSRSCMCAVKDGCAFQAAGMQFTTFDLSDPAEPRALAELTTDTVADEVFGDLYVADGVAYVVGNRNLAAIDVSDPARPVLASEVQVSSMSFHRVAAHHGFAYVIGDHDDHSLPTEESPLEVFDARDPHDVHRVGRFLWPGPRYERPWVEALDGAVYAAGWSDRLEVIDARNPRRPVFVSEVNLAESPCAGGPDRYPGPVQYLSLGIRNVWEVGAADPFAPCGLRRWSFDRIGSPPVWSSDTVMVHTYDGAALVLVR